MAGKTGIWLQGAAVFARIEHLDDEIDETLQKMTLEIEAEAKRLCPVRTGRLRASIHNGKIRERAYFVGTNVEYAPFVEFGTRKMTAKPYLRPAAKKVLNKYKMRGLLK